MGAWLWSHRQAVIAGVAASALHGAEWVDDDAVIELRFNCTRPPRSIIARNETLYDDEVAYVGESAGDHSRPHGIRPRPVPTTHSGIGATRRPDAGEPVLRRGRQAHRQTRPGARGIRQLRELLPLVDGGAMSPQEDAGCGCCSSTPASRNRPRRFPSSTPQANSCAYLDIGWGDFMVAAEYDGDQHRTDRATVRQGPQSVAQAGTTGLGSSCASSKRIAKPTSLPALMRRWSARGWKP